MTKTEEFIQAKLAAHPNSRTVRIAAAMLTFVETCADDDDDEAIAIIAEIEEIAAEEPK